MPSPSISATAPEPTAHRRIYIFADRSNPTGGNSRARELCECLASEASPVMRFTPAGAYRRRDRRSCRLPGGHRDLAVGGMPSVLLPRKGRFRLIDYEKMFCPDPNADIFALRGVNRQTRCLVVARPDQYVAHVLPLDEHDGLTAFFAGILIDTKEGSGVAVGTTASNQPAQSPIARGRSWQAASTDRSPVRSAARRPHPRRPVPNDGPHSNRGAVLVLPPRSNVALP
jgi:Phenol hydroxylase, C-terminal dimerisation domain